MSLQSKSCNLGSLETVAGETPVFALGQAPPNPLPRTKKGGSFGSQHQSRGSVRLSCQLGTPHCALDPGGASTVSSSSVQGSSRFGFPGAGGRWVSRLLYTQVREPGPPCADPGAEDTPAEMGQYDGAENVPSRSSGSRPGLERPSRFGLLCKSGRTCPAVDSGAPGGRSTSSYYRHRARRLLSPAPQPLLPPLSP